MFALAVVHHAVVAVFLVGNEDGGVLQHHVSCDEERVEGDGDARVLGGEGIVYAGIPAACAEARGAAGDAVVAVGIVEAHVGRVFLHQFVEDDHAVLIGVELDGDVVGIGGAYDGCAAVGWVDHDRHAVGLIAVEADEVDLPFDDDFHPNLLVDDDLQWASFAGRDERQHEQKQEFQRALYHSAPPFLFLPSSQTSEHFSFVGPA